MQIRYKKGKVFYGEEPHSDESTTTWTESTTPPSTILINQSCNLSVRDNHLPDAATQGGHSTK